MQRQKRKVRDKSEEGPQPKRLKKVLEEGPSVQLRPELTTRDILERHLKEAKEIWRGQEDLRRQVAGLGFVIVDIVDLIGGSGAEVEVEIGGNREGAEKEG